MNYQMTPQNRPGSRPFASFAKLWVQIGGATDAVQLLLTFRDQSPPQPMTKRRSVPRHNPKRTRGPGTPPKSLLLGWGFSAAHQ
jgi:hypothetical protein